MYLTLFAVDKRVCDSLGLSRCILKIDPGSCGSYELLVSNIALQTEEKLNLEILSPFILVNLMIIYFFSI